MSVLPISFEAPVKIISEMNHGGRGWKGRHFRSRKQRDVVTAILDSKLAYKTARKRLAAAGAEVMLTRIAPRQLDGHDNLRAGFKHVADAIAEWLGIDDSDVQWLYNQERGAVREYAIRVSISSAVDGSPLDT